MCYNALTSRRIIVINPRKKKW